MEGNDLSTLTPAIKLLLQIKTLKLKISQNKSGDELMHSLSLLLPELKSLQILSLDL